MNTKGIKFLAVLAVLAMAFAACAVIANADESVATGEATSTKWNDAGGVATMGPLDFATSGFTYAELGFDNEDLSNDIVVAYDVETKTYTVTGTLGWNANSEAKTDVLKALGMPSTDNYALAFLAVYDGKTAFQVKVGTGALSPEKTANEDCILSMNKAGTSTVTIVGGEYEGTYTIDFSGVALSPSADKNPEAPFVGLKAYNEYVDINVTGSYDTATNKRLGNSVTIVEVDKTSLSLYAEYTIYAKLAYNDFSVDAKGMDYHGEELRYALIWQINGLESFDNYLGVAIPDGMGWNTGSDKDWYHAMASEMENSQETFAFYYKDVDAIASGVSYLYFGPEDMPTQADAGNAECIKINFEIELIKEDQIAADVDDAIAKLAEKDEVELSVGDADVALGTDLVVDNAKTLIISANGTGKVSGDITVGKGTDAQKITLTDFKGTVEITKGSVMILANPWSEGTVTLHNGDVVKLSGEITGAVTFAYEGTSGSAKILVEADTVLDISLGASLTVNSNKIAVEIEGTVEGLGTLDVAAAKSLTVKDGAVLSVFIVESVIGAEKNIVYSGADINDAGIDAADLIYWIGKDAAFGTWTYALGKLTLNNYNGTYNFGIIPEDITKIELNGDNVVTVKAPVERTVEVEVDVDMYTLFGGLALTSITTDGTGSLSIVVDISDVKGEDLAEPSAVILGGDLKINGVTISIFVDGSNIAWTDEQKEELSIAGIFATDGLDFFDAPTMVKMMPDYDYDGIVGIASLGTLDITGKTVIAEAATAFAACDTTTIKTATVDVKGDMVLLDFGFGDVPVGFNNLAISNISTLTIIGTLVAADVTVSQESQITIKDALIDGIMDNKGIVTFNGDVMVTGMINNYAAMENNGFIGVYGWFTNDVSATTAPGVFTNNGTVKVYAMEQRIDAGELVTEASLVIDDATAPTASNAKLKSIAITDALMQFDGTIKFNATIQVYDPTGAVLDVTDAFEGIITPGMHGYIMSLHSNTASITVDYDSTSTEPTKVSKGYKISVTGSVSIWEQSLYLQANTTTAGSEATITTDTVKEGGLYEASAASFVIVAGTVNNNDSITVYTSLVEEIIQADATFNGNLATLLPDVIIAGTFNGDLIAAGEGTATVANFNGNVHSHGSVEVSANKTMTGDIVAKNDVTINGNLVGNITTAGNVAVVNMIGKITVDRFNEDVAAKTATFNGIVMVDLVYNSYYKESTTATDATMFTADMVVVGTPKGLVLDLVKGSDATASADAVAGYFKINATGALDENKTADMTLNEGRLLVDSVTTLEARYYLTIEAGATIEVNKSAASLDVKKAALKVSKDANALFEVGPGTSVNYGKVYFVMAFEIENGAYTIYSDVAYALLNCEENTELYVGESATIDQDVIVKAGVNIVVEDITLTFNGKDVEMLEGAKITLEGAGKVLFKPTESDYESIKKDETITYYTVSATIVYGDNSIVFDEARFINGDSTIQGVAATASADAKIKTDFQLVSGKAMVNGLGTGSIELWNAQYDVTKDATEPETFNVFGTFVVGADAVFDAVKLTDMAGMVTYKEGTDGFEVKEIVMTATVVGVEGTLNLLNSTTVLGNYIGFGKVTIAANNSLTVDSGDIPEAGDLVKDYPGSLNTYVVDTTEDANGYLFNFTAPVAGLADLVLKAEKLTISGEKVDAVTIKGTVGTNSVIKAVDDAFLNGLVLDEDSIIYGENVYVLANSSTLLGGSVGAKAIFMEEAPFADLIYQVVFEDEGYYIYTMFDSIDWDEVSDIAIAYDTVVEKLDLSGRDVHIAIADDATLTVTKLLIIGTPATVIGDEGSSIVGKVVIDSAAGYKAYIVAYADVDLSEAEIVGADGDDAVFSKLDIEDVVYAAIFADEDDELVLAKADASLIPAIIGYNFTAWLNYNGDAKALVGETNAYADAKAVYLTIIVKYVAGVDYYMNGTLFNVYDIPTDVPYGSYFTAKISDTTKYQGNPLINGEKTVCVIDDMELQATGVTPIPEPTPEPVEENTGLSLTDILLIVLIILIAIMVVILVLRLNRS